MSPKTPPPSPVVHLHAGLPPRVSSPARGGDEGGSGHGCDGRVLDVILPDPPEPVEVDDAEQRHRQAHSQQDHTHGEPPAGRDRDGQVGGQSGHTVGMEVVQTDVVIK